MGAMGMDQEKYVEYDDTNLKKIDPKEWFKFHNKLCWDKKKARFGYHEKTSFVAVHSMPKNHERISKEGNKFPMYIIAFSRDKKEKTGIILHSSNSYMYRIPHEIDKDLTNSLKNYMESKKSKDSETS